VQWADERYRGGPSNPINDADLDAKFLMCAEGVISDNDQAELLRLVRGIDKGADIKRLMALISGDGAAAGGLAAE